MTKVSKAVTALAAFRKLETLEPFDRKQGNRVRRAVKAIYATTPTTDEERLAMLDLVIGYEGDAIEPAAMIALESLRRSLKPNLMSVAA